MTEVKFQGVDRLNTGAKESLEKATSDWELEDNSEIGIKQAVVKSATMLSDCCNNPGEGKRKISCRE